jgi:hypothetical protein
MDLKRIQREAGEGGYMKERNPPNKWKVVPFANVGTDEEFVRRMLEMFQLLGGTPIPDKQKEIAKDAIADILSEGLIPTFLELRNIRSSVGADLPLINKLQLYEDFARKLWKSYKDLTQRATAAMGFDIGFLFQDEKKFEAGLKNFRAENPSVLVTFEYYLRETRKRWQNDLGKFRNTFLEHKLGDRNDFRRFYEPATAEELFSVVSRTIVDILVCMMNLRMWPGMRIVEYDPNVHGPGWPNRFKWEIDSLPGNK